MNWEWDEDEPEPDEDLFANDKEHDGRWQFDDVKHAWDLVDTDMSFQVHGKCFTDGYPMEFFFPEKTEHEERAEAKAVCAACPVRKRCFEFAINNTIRFGIYGGTSASERDKIRWQRAPMPDWAKDTAPETDPIPPQHPLHPTVQLQETAA